MRMAFLAKYSDFGLLLLRLSIGILFILYTAPALMGGPSAWAHFGADFRTALPSIEMCFVLAGILFVGPGKYGVDKT